MFGTAVELDHVFGSKWALNHFGFCVIYYEVNRFKQSVVENDNIIDLVSMLNGTFSQWTGDNVDWDGKVKLHGMGAIVSTTGGNIDQLNSNLPILPRQKRKNVDEIVKGKGIPVLQCSKGNGMIA